MANDVVIRAEGLGKKYLVGHRADRERHPVLRDVIAGTVRQLARSAIDMAHGRQLVQGDNVEEFWALKDVSFEIRRGEVVGIIGRNGSGKSTLLKILSRITEPSAGRAEIRGRVASLLEVGTGFHPELSGRENIYLNGAILGMTRAEITRKFDEIVEFAEVAKFLDTPVKRYSSGMYVRLAFAVAAHLEPEILIVDEVLAVGDAEFQKKCLGRMGEVARGGRTVLFVSHNRKAIARLCETAVWLQDGVLRGHGTALDILTKYTSGAAQLSPFSRPSDVASLASIESMTLRTRRNSQPDILNTDAICLELQLRIIHEMNGLRLSIDIRDGTGQVVFTTRLADANLAIGTEVGYFSAEMTIPPLTLMPGTLAIKATLWSEAAGILDVVEDYFFRIQGDPYSPISVEDRQGLFTVACAWQLRHWSPTTDDTQNSTSASTDQNCSIRTTSCGG